jgi:hypothetical protein
MTHASVPALSSSSFETLDSRFRINDVWSFSSVLITEDFDRYRHQLIKIKRLCLFQLELSIDAE